MSDWEQRMSERTQAKWVLSEAEDILETPEDDLNYIERARKMPHVYRSGSAIVFNPYSELPDLT